MLLLWFLRPFASGFYPSSPVAKTLVPTVYYGFGTGFSIGFVHASNANDIAITMTPSAAPRTISMAPA